MRFTNCLLVALCLSASMLSATDPPKLSLAQQEVLNIRKARLEAISRRDMVAWARYVADDCILTDDDGGVQTKAQFIEGVAKLPPEYDHAANPRDYVVHVHGNTAVVNLRVTIHEQATDTDLISEQRYTETYIKQDGSWLLIAQQVSDLPINLRKPVAVDTSVYRDYVGQYQWRPLDDVETVSVKDGRLWSQLGKDQEEYLPLGSDTFFLKDDLGTMTFVRDSQGHVTGYTYHRADGQETHDKKIK